MSHSYVLGDHFEQFVADQVSSGRFEDASDVVRAGLKLLEEQERLRPIKLDTLRSEIEKGINALADGRFVEARGEDELKALFNHVKQKGRQRLADSSTE